MDIMDVSTMNQQTTKVIMQNIKDLKFENKMLMEEKENWEIVYKKQKERMVDMEEKRNVLIRLLNQKVDVVRGYKTEIESLRIENSHLNSTIQDQNSLIDEHSRTIEQLKKENALLKKKRNEPNNVIERGIKQPVPVKHVITINGTNGNHFSHPSFDPPTSDVHKKKKKKSPLALRNRYSNLDISGSGIRRKEESPEENNKSPSPTGKKRRLYSLEDDMIDLTIDANEE